jgi:hypothetical protein
MRPAADRMGCSLPTPPPYRSSDLASNKDFQGNGNASVARETGKLAQAMRVPKLVKFV